MAQAIQLTNAPNQSVAVTLSVNGSLIALGLTIGWNAAGEFWVMDVADQAGNALASSVPLITGAWPAGNILSAVGYLGIGSAFIINQTGALSDRPGADNLGQYLLVWDDN